MEKTWLKTYPTDVPADIDPGQVETLVELFEKASASYANKTAYLSLGAKLTYAELDRQSAYFAAWLQSLGVAKGDRIALMLPNLLQYPVALFGVLRAGCVVVSCNPLYTPRELEHQLKDSFATILVVLENFAHTVEQCIANTQVRHVVVTSMGEMLGPLKGPLVNFIVRHVKKLVPDWNLPGSINFSQALTRGRRHRFISVEVVRDDLAFLQYTGGTTGVSKGAMLTHGNIGANVAQAYAWICKGVREGEETILTALPLYHVFALTANCLTFFKIGATNLLITNPRDISGFIKEWRKHPVSVITGVNTLFNALLNHPDFATLDFTSLRITMGGGMAVQTSVAQRWKAVTGVTMLQAYGLTECSPAVTMDPLDLDDFNGSIGLPISSTEVAVRDDAGRDLGLNQIGEICVRGPQVMLGYWQRREETTKVFHADRFLRTGDLGYMDEKGFIFLVDRKKDVIIVSGFNVYPTEVEEAVALHPDVLEVAAIGVTDEHSGEAVKLYVVRKDPALDERTLIEHCRSVLTGYKIPKRIEFRDSLPHTSIGKILRRALKTSA